MGGLIGPATKDKMGLAKAQTNTFLQPLIPGENRISASVGDVYKIYVDYWGRSAIIFIQASVEVIIVSPGNNAQWGTESQPATNGLTFSYDGLQKELIMNNGSSAVHICSIALLG